MSDPTRGVYEKFTVKRTDGKSAPGAKHDGCDYFVLDLTHDPHAPAALRAYAESCRDQYPLLARDLFARLPEVDADTLGACMERRENGQAVDPWRPLEPAAKPGTCGTCGGRGYVGACDCGAEKDGLGGHDWECSASGPADGPAAERKPCPDCSGAGRR